MPKLVRVDPVAVQQTGDTVDTTADALRAKHAAALESIGQAQSGWIGASQAALTAQMARWEDESASQYTELVGHAYDLRSAAFEYAKADEEGQTCIDAAAEGIDAMGL
jgi:WXG100 family type VII secretion target